MRPGRSPARSPTASFPRPFSGARPACPPGAGRSGEMHVAAGSCLAPTSTPFPPLNGFIRRTGTGQASWLYFRDGASWSRGLYRPWTCVCRSRPRGKRPRSGFHPGPRLLTPPRVAVSQRASRPDGHRRPRPARAFPGPSLALCVSPSSVSDVLGQLRPRPRRRRRCPACWHVPAASDGETLSPCSVSSSLFVLKSFRRTKSPLPGAHVGRLRSQPRPRPAAPAPTPWETPRPRRRPGPGHRKRASGRPEARLPFGRRW